MVRATKLYGVKAILLLSLIAPMGDSSAATGFVAADVNEVLISADNTWGGCMALLSVGPETQLASCAPRWVTFSCSGEFTDPARGYRMVDVAEHAFATGRPVKVWFTDDMRHNGYCFAHRIDISRE